MIELVATRAPALLRAFNAAGVLTAADIHVAQRLGRLTGESSDVVLLAVALTVRGTRHGSVVLDLATAADTTAADVNESPEGGDVLPISTSLAWPQPVSWAAAVAASPITNGMPGTHPVVMQGTRLWLDRYWQQEASVANELLGRSARNTEDLHPDDLRADLDELFSDPDQRRAAAVAALSPVSVIAGGPGTGKTTTIARLLTLLWRQRRGLRIALAAPTGKASARLTEAIRAEASRLPAEDGARLLGLTAVTLHRLLGRRPDSASRFRHDRDNHVPYDVVVVDETSMVSLTLMARLLDALAPSARLVLVGDPDQLASVEAGAVLGDLVDPADIGPVTAGFAQRLGNLVPDVDATRPDGPGALLRQSVSVLTRVYRFDEGGPIAELAELVRLGRSDEAVALLRDGADGLWFDDVADDGPVPAAALSHVQNEVLTHERAVIAAAKTGDIDGALAALDRHRLLCAHRSGPRGTRGWSLNVERWLANAGDISPRPDGRYAGQPLLVTSNDYELGLFNGDTGVIVVDEQGELGAAFRRGDRPTVLPLVRLGDVRPLHAMTVHRSQGSQFTSVTVLLPAPVSPLATRQTLYTALTRASARVRIVGSDEAVRACIQRQAARATGLRSRLDGQLAV